jgi:hypothetical protein
MDLQRMVQVDGGPAITLAKFIEINLFSEIEIADLHRSLARDGRWTYGGGAASPAEIEWASDRAVLEAEWANWLTVNSFEDGSLDEHLMWNHDLTDEHRVWIEAFRARWEAMEAAEDAARHVHTNDVGLAIRDALDLLDGIDVMDWDKPEPVALYTQQDVVTDAGHGFSDLRVEVGGALFRVSITRIG